MYREWKRRRVSTRRDALSVAFCAQCDSNRFPSERQRECEPDAAERCGSGGRDAEPSVSERSVFGGCVEPVGIARARRQRRRPMVPGVGAVRSQACHLVLVYVRLDALRLVRARRRALPLPRPSGAHRLASLPCRPSDSH